MLLFEISSLRIIHFGVNPVRGGNPPSDIKIIRIIGVKRGDLLHRLDIDSVVVFLYKRRSINMLIVRVM